MPQKRVLVKWKTSQLKKKTYMKAEIKKKAYKRQNVRNIWDMEKKSIIYIIEIPKEKRERDKGRNHT